MQQPTAAGPNSVPQDSPDFEIVDLARYPLRDRGGDSYRARLETAWRELDDDGCCVLPGFVRPEKREALARETREFAPLAHFSAQAATVYGGEPDPDVAADHPLRHQVMRDNGFVAGDHIPGTTAVRRLYHADEFRTFIGACLGLDTIHEYADPIAQLVINVLRPGKGHGWHFDTNEFTVTLLTQAPSGGGQFEYVPQLRSADDENHDGVAAILRGDRSRVKVLDLRVGDLQVFRGRYSLHRVSPVGGDRDRLTTIFAYTEQSGVVGDPVKTRRLYGRLTDSHQGGSVRAEGSHR